MSPPFLVFQDLNECVVRWITKWYVSQALFFCIASCLREKDLAQCVLFWYSYGVLSKTGELILRLCHFVSFHFWPCSLNYKHILCTSELLFSHTSFDFFMQNSSSHLLLYLLLFLAQLLEILLNLVWIYIILQWSSRGHCNWVGLVLLGCSCRFHTA